jgi:eukaryotic-like serine/threonine-protein kinase
VASIPNLQPGQVFAQRYRVVRLLKAGGMGAVYEVRHAATDKRWALKLMNPSLARDANARQRFEREAKIDALIESAFVASVIDAGIDEATEAPYLVMEFLVGEDLGEQLLRAGPLPAASVVAYLRDVARALDKAHAKNIVHRDLKPENLFLCQSDEEGERVKVLDFGIAKLLESVGHSSTQSAGTPGYMAPEQWSRGREIGPWTDLWALGLIAYELLVGKSYWQAETTGELYGEILSQGPREAPSTRATEAGMLLPKAFDAWFFRCVDNDPKRRFAQAGEAIAELASAFGADLQSSLSSTPATASASQTLPIATQGTPSWPRSGALPSTQTTEGPISASTLRALGIPRSGRAWRYAKVALGGVLLCAVGAGARELLTRQGRTPRPTTEIPLPNLPPATSSDPVVLAPKSPDGLGVAVGTTAPLFHDRGSHHASKLAPSCRGAARWDGSQCVPVCDAGASSPCKAVGAVSAHDAGASKDEGRGVALDAQTCDGGDAQGCSTLGGTSPNPTPGIADEHARAIALYKQACDSGDASGCSNLGLMVANATGGIKDEVLAATLYRKACDGGNAVGCSNLGLAYANGRGVSQDGARALALFKQACDGGAAPGCSSLGSMYETGTAVAMDRAEAVRLYRLGCKAGNDWGCAQLKRLGTATLSPE